MSRLIAVRCAQTKRTRHFNTNNSLWELGVFGVEEQFMYIYIFTEFFQQNLVHLWSVEVQRSSSNMTEPQSEAELIAF